MLGFYNSLLSAVAHEFKTPLAVLIAAADSLLDDRNPSSPHHQKILLQEISGAAMALNRYVGNILDSSRLEAGCQPVKKDWTDISELIHEALFSLQGIEETHYIKVETEKDCPLFLLDKRLTEQAIRQILQNAALYTPPHSEIRVKAGKDGEELVVNISDNGPGFRADGIEKVFDRFYRFEKNNVKGTGLGLYISKGFVEAQGGSIDLENIPGGGASFTLRFPSPSYYTTKNLTYEPA